MFLTIKIKNKVDVSLFMSMDVTALYAYFYHNPTDPYSTEKELSDMIAKRNKKFKDEEDIVAGFNELFERDDTHKMKLQNINKYIMSQYPAMKISPKDSKKLAAYLRENDFPGALHNGVTVFGVKLKR